MGIVFHKTDSDDERNKKLNKVINSISIVQALVSSEQTAYTDVVETKLINHVVLGTEDVILVNPLTEDITITLPSSALNLVRKLVIKNISVQGWKVEVLASNNIDDALNVPLESKESVTIISDGTSYHII